MTKRRNYVVLAGSERREREDARAIGSETMRSAIPGSGRQK